MTCYERVTFRTEKGRSRTVYLRQPVVAESPILGSLLTGVEVDIEGDEVAPRGVDERRHIIGLDAVVRRVPMYMNNDFGLLEEVR